MSASVAIFIYLLFIHSVGIYYIPTKYQLLLNTHFRWRYSGEWEKVTVMILQSIGKMEKTQVIKHFESIKCYQDSKLG